MKFIIAIIAAALVACIALANVSAQEEPQEYVPRYIIEGIDQSGAPLHPLRGVTTSCGDVAFGDASLMFMFVPLLGLIRLWPKPKVKVCERIFNGRTCLDEVEGDNGDSCPLLCAVCQETVRQETIRGTMETV